MNLRAGWDGWRRRRSRGKVTPGNSGETIAYRELEGKRIGTKGKIHQLGWVNGGKNGGDM